jgi:hypothetical protein
MVVHTEETHRLKAFKNWELKGMLESKKGEGVSQVR